MTNPFAPRDQIEVLQTECRFPKYKDVLWEKVISIDPDYVVWLDEEGLLYPDEKFLADLAYETEFDDGWDDPSNDPRWDADY